MMASHTTLEEKFDELQKAEETPQISAPKIQKVPEYLRNRTEFKKYYLPRLMSIGPIHHGNANLKLGEKYKLMWAAQYIKKYTSKIALDLHKKILDKIDELKGLFAEDVLTATGESLKGFRSLDEKLSWILFIDGCSLLYFLAAMNADDNPEEILNIMHAQLFPVMMDVLLLENQLPYLVLKLLWEKDDQHELIHIMNNFLEYTHWTPENETKSDNSVTPDNNMTLSSVRSRIQTCFSVLNKKKEEEEQQQQHSVSIPNESELPTHLLDLQRKIILSKSSSKPG
ncbi:uncharacterized protein LOC123902259 [Trifolium pratense]|uniref:uncharacterized protein LOC123902259 n=1 Tax=Trifolium pratense TaxID=57577 RepID=UPI001E691E61|nr:uncharacterized protein LOC123902259 [Trifolium pratense]